MIAALTIVLLTASAANGRAAPGDANSPATVAPQLDLNGPDLPGINFSTTFTENESPRAIVAPDLALVDPDSETMRSATLTLAAPVDKTNESISVEASGTSISAVYNPNTGALRLTGSASLDDYRQVLRTAAYVNRSESPSSTPRSISFVVADGENESEPAVATVAIVPVNDAPILDSESGLRFSEISEDDPSPTGDTVAQLLASAGSVPISDPDVNDPLGIAVIEANSTNGIWQAAFGGGPAWLTLTDVSDTAAVLLDTSARLRFVPDANFNGQARITFRAWDHSFGSSGATGVNASVNGGTSAFSSNSETVIIRVLPVNDPPVIDPNGRLSGTNVQAAFLAERLPVPLTAVDAVVDDVDNNEIVSLVVTLENRPDGAAESIVASLPQSAIQVKPYDPATGRLVLSGTAPTAEYTTLLRRLRYANSSAIPDPTERTFSFIVNDGSVDSVAAFTILQPVLANAQPVLDESVLMRFRDIAEDDPHPSGDSVAELLATAAADPISDPDTGAKKGFAVTAVQDDNGVWQFSTDAGQTWLPFGPVSETAATLLDEGARIRFLPEADFAGVPRSIRVHAWDQTDGAPGFGGIDITDNPSVSIASVAISLTIIPANDAPLLTMPAGVTAMYSEGSDPVVIAGPTLDLRDSDNTSLQSAEVRIVGKLPSEPDYLAASEGSPVAAEYDPVTGILRLTGAAPVAAYQAVLRSVTFVNTAEDPDTTDRRIQFQASDGEATSNVVEALVKVEAADDAPRLDLNGDAAAGDDHVVFYDEDEDGVGRPVLLAAQMEIEDVDDTALVGAELLLEPRPDGAAESLQVNTVGTNIAAVYDLASGQLRLTGQDSLASYRKVLRSATYSNLDQFANKALRKVRFTAQDGQGTSIPRTTTIVVRPQLVYFPLTAQAGAGVVPSDEPNNSCSQAFEIATNVRHAFDANDANDWYRFRLFKSGATTVELTDFGPREGQILVASGNCGTLRRIGHNGDFATTKRIDLGSLEAGTYYVWLINDGPTDLQTPYHLEVMVR